MKIAVIGCNGQLGQDMMKMLKTGVHEINGIDFPEIDITRRNLTQNLLENLAPEIIINCAAYTNVDACEENKEQAFAVNSQGVLNLALSAKSLDAKMIHISTDYVFKGDAKVPYKENDSTGPLTVYGQSKLEGERKLSDTLEKHFIFRVAWLYGANGNNFVKSMISLGLKKKKENGFLKVVNDQFGTPTFTVEVCRQILALMDKDEYGIYHCTNKGACSWFDFACLILKSKGIDVHVHPCKTEEFPRPAPRPGYSVLENQHLKSLNKNQMKPWKDAFKEFITTI